MVPGAVSADLFVALALLRAHQQALLLVLLLEERLGVVLVHLLVRPLVMLSAICAVMMIKQNAKNNVIWSGIEISLCVMLLAQCMVLNQKSTKFVWIELTGYM